MDHVVIGIPLIFDHDYYFILKIDSNYSLSSFLYTLRSSISRFSLPKSQISIRQDWWGEGGIQGTLQWQGSRICRGGMSR
jgi:hypothetical protein